MLAPVTGILPVLRPHRDYFLLEELRELSSGKWFLFPPYRLALWPAIHLFPA